MTDFDKSRLLRQNDMLSDELARTKVALKESRTALINAQLTLQALAQTCGGLIAAVKASDLDAEPKSLAPLEEALVKLDDATWLTALREDAFGRGFAEGCRFARLNKHSLGTEADVLQHYKDRTESIWPSAEKSAPGSWFRSVPPSTVRYSYNPGGSEPLILDNNGPFMDFSVYADLRTQFDLLKEELSGYKWLLHDPQAPPIPANFAYDAAKAHVRKPQKDGIVKVQYGKNGSERDLFVLYGYGVPNCDRALVMCAFSSKRMSFDYVKRQPEFGRSLVEELAVRGYDLSTLRFSICKKV